MSEQKFKQAKSSLAFSQSLLDSMRQQQAPMEATEGQEMPQEAMPEPIVEEEAVVEEKPQEEPISEATEPVEEEEKEDLGATLKYFMDEVRGMFKKKENDDKSTIEKTVKSSLKEMLNEEDKDT